MWPPQLLTLPHSQPSHLFPLNLEITSFLGGCSFPIETTLCCMASLGIRVLFFFFWCVVGTPRHTPLTEPDFHSLRYYQLIIDHQLVVIVCGHFPCFMLWFFSPAGASTDVFHVVLFAMSSYEHLPCCTWETLLTWSYPPFLTLIIFTPFFPKRSLRLWGVWYNIPF